MVVYLVLQTRVANLVGAGVLVQAVAASIRQQQAVECHSESSLTEGLNGSCLPQQPGAAGDDDLLTAVRIHGIGDKAIHRRRGTSVEAVRQHRVDDRPLENAMHRTRIVNRIGMRRTL